MVHKQGLALSLHPMLLNAGVRVELCKFFAQVGGLQAERVVDGEKLTLLPLKG